jgi:hypothetical protein
VLEAPPPSAIRTPMRDELTGTATGAAALSQTASPLEVPTLVRGVEASTVPVASSTKYARPARGSTSGTATGSAPRACRSAWMTTRAWALIAGTTSSPKNQGKLASVIFTSTMRAAHGGPPSL